MKKRIRLTESDLHRIVKESVNRILKEAALNKSMRAHNRLLKEYYEDDDEDDYENYVLPVEDLLDFYYDDGERTQNLLNCLLKYEDVIHDFSLKNKFTDFCQRYNAAVADLKEQNEKHLLEPDTGTYDSDDEDGYDQDEYDDDEYDDFPFFNHIKYYEEEEYENYVLEAVEGLLEDYDEGRLSEQLLNCLLEYEDDIHDFSLKNKFPEICQRYSAALADLKEQNEKHLLEPETGSSKIYHDVSQIVRRMGSQIYEWFDATPTDLDNTFVDTRGWHGYIFKNEAEAENFILSDDDALQNARNVVIRAQSGEEWVDYLIRCGIDKNVARDVISKNDLDSLVKMTLRICGPQFFLSTSGKVHKLSDGSLLYY